MRELIPTVTVPRGDVESSNIGVANAALEPAIDALMFEDLHGQRRSWADSLSYTYTDGIIAMHRGVRIYERYFGALHPRRAHSCFSVTKSYAATLAATLIHERALEENRQVTHYLPEMAATAYNDATVRQLLDMRVAVDFSEDYANPQADFWKYARAGGFRARSPECVGPGSYYEYLVTLRNASGRGAGFEYKTATTEVLCWILRRISGRPLPDLLSERIWSRIGCEEDGYLAVDSMGVAMGGAGLSACLRDMCRFGELMRCEGAWHGRQVIPAEVVADIRIGADRGEFARAGYKLMPGYSYRNMWWVSHNSLGVFEARGIHGQRIYVAPKAELVIARFSSHPIATNAANDPITLPAFAALCRYLTNG